MGELRADPVTAVQQPDIDIDRSRRHRDQKHIFERLSSAVRLLRSEPFLEQRAERHPVQCNPGRRVGHGQLPVSLNRQLLHIQAPAGPSVQFVNTGYRNVAVVIRTRKDIIQTQCRIRQTSFRKRLRRQIQGQCCRQQKNSHQFLYHVNKVLAFTENIHPPSEADAQVLTKILFLVKNPYICHKNRKAWR